MEFTPFFSLIVPVYNVEKYLEQCVDSILNQKFKDFEIILVNDGSTDKSEEICDLYLKKDKRVRVFHQKNGGLSVARNTGISKVKGNYIWFVDSDDWISDDALNILFQYLKTEENEVLGFSYKSYDEIQKKNSESLLKNSLTFKTTGADYFKNCNDFFPAIWVYVYKNQFIRDNDLTFKEGLLHEDDYFNLSCFGKISNFQKVNNDLYFYRIRPQSITSLQSFSNLQNRINAFIELIMLSEKITDLDPIKLKKRIGSYKARIYSVLLDIYKLRKLNLCKLYKISNLSKSVIGQLDIKKENLSRKEYIVEFLTKKSFNINIVFFLIIQRTLYHYFNFLKKGLKPIK